LYGIDVSQSLYDSLNVNEWLTSGAVDYFFRHLDKSYNDNQLPKQSLRCWTTFMFEKYIPSSLVSSKLNGKYEFV
jgi:hypothetical protein